MKANVLFWLRASIWKPYEKNLKYIYFTSLKWFNLKLREIKKHKKKLHKLISPKQISKGIINKWQLYCYKYGNK